MKKNKKDICGVQWHDNSQSCILDENHEGKHQDSYIGLVHSWNNKDDVVRNFVDVICNMCGDSCNLTGDKYPGLYGLIDQKVSGGYSSIIGDGLTYNFSMCEFCVWKLIAQFKVKPNITSYFGNDNVDPVTNTESPILISKRSQEDAVNVIKKNLIELNKQNQIQNLDTHNFEFINNISNEFFTKTVKNDFGSFVGGMNQNGWAQTLHCLKCNLTLDIYDDHFRAHIDQYPDFRANTFVQEVLECNEIIMEKALK